MADGKLQAVTWKNLMAGTVVRMVSEDGSIAQHSDSTIVALYSDSRTGETIAKLVRPYMIVDRETHAWSVGFEQYEVHAHRMMGPENFRWQVVCYDNGEPASVLR